MEVSLNKLINWIQIHGNMPDLNVNKYVYTKTHTHTQTLRFFREWKLGQNWNRNFRVIKQHMLVHRARMTFLHKVFRVIHVITSHVYSCKNPVLQRTINNNYRHLSILSVNLKWNSKGVLCPWHIVQNKYKLNVGPGPTALIVCTGRHFLLFLQMRAVKFSETVYIWNCGSWNISKDIFNHAYKH
jgi:hypothetical protein